MLATGEGKGSLTSRASQAPPSAFHAVADWLPRAPTRAVQDPVRIGWPLDDGGKDGEEMSIAPSSFQHRRMLGREEEEEEKVAINLSAQPASQYLRLVGARN